MNRLLKGGMIVGVLAAGAAAGAVVWGSSALAGSRTAARPVAETTAAARPPEASRTLSGFAEVPARLTDGSGTFTAKAHDNQIDYTLTYWHLLAPATVAHIHFSEPGVNGGVVAFLCGGGGKPACPPTGGTVTGTITAADIQAVATPGPNDQGVAAGDILGALQILRSGDAYVNVHSTRFAAGEIRGQLHAAGEDTFVAES